MPGTRRLSELDAEYQLAPESQSVESSSTAGRRPEEGVPIKAKRFLKLSYNTVTIFVKNSSKLL